jgi:hypothetical protein
MPDETAPQAPSIGRIVLVKTTVPINGRTEHAAIVTDVFGDTWNAAINATLFPSSGASLPVNSIWHESVTAAGGSWRWPPRI